jgi:hypothetical protein
MKIRGTTRQDEIKICGILQQRSDPHLHAIAAGYQAKYHKKLSQA